MFKNRRVQLIEQLESRTLLSIPEPNDTLATAYNVDPTGNGFGGMATFSDSISDSDQRDFYKVPLRGARNGLVARLYNLGADLQLALIYDQNGNGMIEPTDLLKISVNAGTTEELITRSMTSSPLYQSDNYYIEVYTAGSGNNTSYSLDLTADTAPDSPQQFPTYLPSTGGHSINESLNSTDDLYDVFAIDLSSYGNYNYQTSFSLRLTANTPSNYHVDLLEDLNNNRNFDAGELLTTSKPVGGAQEIAPQTLSSNSGHIFYLRVLHSAPATENYSLHYEVDNAGSSPGTAYSLGGIEGYVSSKKEFLGSLTTTSYNDPEDYFKFSIVNSGVRLYSKVDVFTADSDPLARVSYEIFRDVNNNGVKDSGDTVVSSGSSASGGGVGSASNEPPGTYYAHFTGVGYANYSFTVNGDRVPGIVGSNKFSDSLDYGTITGERALDETLGANDYSDTYKLTFATAGAISARFLSAPEGVTGNIAVDLNKNGMLDPGEILGTFAPSQPRKISVPAGPVYVTITAPTSLIANYDALITPDFAGDTPQTARNLGALGSGAFLSFQDDVSKPLTNYVPDDPDYYKFSVSSTQTFTAALYGANQLSDLQIVLYQDNGSGTLTELQRVSGADDRKFLQRTISAGQYQVEILNSDAQYFQDGYNVGFSTGDNDDQIGEVDLLPGNQIPVAGGKDGTLSDLNDVDLIKISPYTLYGHVLALDVDSRNGSTTNTYLRVFDSTGKQLAFNDDGAAPGETASGFSYLAYRFPTSGVFYVGISAKGNTNYSAVTGFGDAGGTSSGQYRLNITDITPTPGSIAGVVFNDLNGNGIKDSGESGLAQRAVFIDLDGNQNWDDGEDGAYTDATGAYKLTNIPPGTYTLRQRLPAGWTQTSPAGGAGLLVTVNTAQNVTGANFGAHQGSAPSGSLSGFVYNDLNGNGLKDAGETGIAGRTVYIDTNNNSSLDAGEKSTLTNSSGQYTLASLAGGTYKLREVRPTGWTQILPLNNFGLNVTISAGQNSTNNNFFIRPTPAGTGSISGNVFHDFSRNGIKDSGDTGLANFVLFIDLDNDSVLDTNEQRVLSDSSGNYIFRNLGAGTYKIRLLLQAGYVQTLPASNFGQNATLSSGSSVVSGKNFGADN